MTKIELTVSVHKDGEQAPVTVVTTNAAGDEKGQGVAHVPDITVMPGETKKFWVGDDVRVSIRPGIAKA